MKRKFIDISKNGPVLEFLEHPDSCAFLFYPGTMIEPGHYILFLNYLYQAGFSVYALHLAGHGQNKRKVGTFEHMLEQGLTAQEWILKNKTASLVVGGHSQGGICSLGHGALTDKPAAIFGLGACLPQLPSSINATRFGRIKSQKKKIINILKGISKIFPDLPIPLPLYLSGHKILANCRQPLITGKGKSRISYPARFLDSLFTCEIPQQMKCPLWLIGARGDGLFNETLISETFESISAPQKTLEYLPAGGHLAILNPWLAKYAAFLCACTALSLKQELNTNI